MNHVDRPGALGGQKRELDSPKLELQMVLSFLVSGGDQL